jgi:hypothetical protein
MVCIPKIKLESLVTTVGTLQDRYVMYQIKKSERDIIRGNVRSAGEFLKYI